MRKPLLAIAGLAAALSLSTSAALAATTTTCDTTDSSACLLPYPNNHFTVSDSKKPTKLHLSLPSTGTPANNSGVHIDPTEWNRNDGFSPGSMLLTFIPGLDLVQSKINLEVSPQHYSDTDAGAIVIDKATGQRWPIFGEIDAVSTTGNQDLILRPLVNFTEGHTYVVILRNMKTASGALIAPNADFKKLRDKKATGTLAKRKSEFESMFSVATKAKVTRSSIYLMWQFTVASQQSLSGRLLSIRNQAFGALGDTTMADRTVQGSSPSFTIDRVKTRDYTAAQNSQIVRRVYGTINVPCFLNRAGCPAGASMNYGADGNPKQMTGNVDQAPFVCNIPRSSVNEDASAVTNPAFSIIYGHGLVGNYEAITHNEAYAAAGNDYHSVMCGLDWQGMSSNDLANIGLGVLPNLSNFKSIPDRLQQAQLNFMFLGRALIHANGLGTDPAFRFGGQSVLNGSAGYSGDSQGGILGGALMSMAPDFRWGSLGVPGQNYSTLLDRSTDWPEYGQILYDAYPKGKERPLLMALIQQLWDRGEANGYSQHIGKNPLPGSPTNTVLLLPAWGDHQVTNLAAENYARTIGAKLRTPALDHLRNGPFNVFWNITNGGATSITGNAMLMMDTGPPRAASCTSWSCAANPLTDPDPCKSGSCKGSTPRPVGNIAPSYGQDPHGVGGDSAEVRRLVFNYVRTGTLLPGCDGLPCGIGGWQPGL